MATRDVELVIKAKDSAGKVLDNLTKALNDLVGATSDATASTERGETAFARFGKSVSNLDKAFRGMTGAEKIADQFKRASTATEQLDRNVEAARSSVDALAQSVDKAATSTAKFQKELADTGKSLADQKKALTDAKAAHSALTEKLSEASAERRKLETAERNLSKAITDQEARLAKTQARYASIQAEISQVEQPTKRLVNSLNAAAAAITKQDAALASSRQKLIETKQALTAAEASVEGFAASVAQSEAALAQQRTAVEGISQQYKQVEKATRDAIKTQKDLGKEFEKAGSDLARIEAGADQARGALSQIEAGAKQAEVAMTQFAAAARGPLSDAFRAQQSTVSRINNTYQQIRGELKALSIVMGQVGVPTKAMADQFTELNTVAKDIATEYQKQQAVLKQLGSALKTTATDSATLAAQMRTAQASVQQGAQALGRVSTEANKAAASNQKLVSAQNQLAAGFSSTASATRSAAEASRQLAGANDQAAESYRRQANASRQAMSYVQRLRGEVLSLVSAYGGIFGVIELLNKTVKAYQTLEAAQSRLNAVNRGDQQATANDLDFIRRNADRLGIEFGTLANEFTKFAAATDRTSIAGQKTRDIFLSVAEAGRVNKLSLEDMNGIFRALIQIASKGKIQLEELSGQLGDRLPGALQILADGMGITVEQLLDMTQKGEVMSDNLTKFAEELDRRYGGQLAKSLETTTTALGQLQNAAFQALLAFGEAGFLEGFTQLLRDLTEVLQSPAFNDFAGRISVLFGALAEALGFAAQNFQLVTVAASAFIGIKLAGVVTAWGQSLLSMAAAARTSQVAVAAFGATAATTGGAAAVAATRIGLLAGAFRALLSSTGIGLLVTGISVGIGYWATRAEEATTAMNTHRDMVDRVKNAYENAARASTDWAKASKGASLTEAQAALRENERLLKSARAEATKLFSGKLTIFDVGSTKAQSEELKKLAQQYRDGKLSIDDYIKSLNAVAQATDNKMFRGTIEATIAQVRANEELTKATEEARLAVEALGDDTEKAEAAARKLSGAVTDTGKAMGDSTQAADAFKTTLEEIKQLLPGVSDEMKKQAEIAQGWGKILSAISQLNFSNLSFENLGTIFSGAQSLYNQQQELDFGDMAKELAGATDGIQAAAKLIARKEGFQATPYIDWSKDSAGNRINTGLAIGYGAKQIILADGSIKKITEGMRISQSEAQVQLARQLQKTYIPQIIRQIGPQRFNSFNPQQQAALGSIAYNYGSLPERILAAVRTGTANDISNAIRGLGGDNAGVNRQRRNEEAYLFSNAGFEEAAGERAVENERKKAEEAAKFHEQQKLSNEQAVFELSIQDENIIKREQAKAIREAELAAQQAGTELTAAEREQILANVEAKYREQAAQDAVNASKKAAEEADQRVNDLMTRRNELEAQLAIYQQQGNTEMVAQTQAAIAGVNTELEKAINNAIAMYQALGGPGADAAIAKLQTIKLETANVSANAKTAMFDWKRVGELFASGLTNAFDKFARAVAEGKNIGEAAAEAFLQFAADFLIEIGKMIIQQAILNALRAIGGPFAGIGMGHTGGVVGSKRIGSGNATRRVDPGLFATAPRFHGGGLPGLRPNEVPAVLKRGEEVLSENDPRNILNGGSKAGGQSGAAPSASLADRIRIVNAFDAASVVSEGLSSAAGEQTLMNWVQSNRNSIKELLS